MFRWPTGAFAESRTGDLLSQPQSIPLSSNPAVRHGLLLTRWECLDLLRVLWREGVPPYPTNAFDAANLDGPSHHRRGEGGGMRHGRVQRERSWA